MLLLSSKGPSTHQGTSQTLVSPALIQSVTSIPLSTNDPSATATQRYPLSDFRELQNLPSGCLSSWHLLHFLLMASGFPLGIFVSPNVQNIKQLPTGTIALTHLLPAGLCGQTFPLGSWEPLWICVRGVEDALPGTLQRSPNLSTYSSSGHPICCHHLWAADTLPALRFCPHPF